MVCSMPARMLLRVDHKNALPRLNLYLHWLRVLEFMCTTAFLGIFLHFSIGLPHGFDISSKMTAVYALSIAAAVYPVLVWMMWLFLRAKKRKVLYMRISRATDSLIVAPLLLGLAVVLGNAGLPRNCEELYIFDRGAYLAIGKRDRNGTLPCVSNVTANDCGTGVQQVHNMGRFCRTARAGFGLVIVTIVVVYLMIALVNWYLYYKPREDGTVARPNTHRRGPSLGNAASESTQRLTDMSQLEAAHIANGDSAPGEPPPPYTSRPGNNERIASADEVRRTNMMTSLTRQMTMTLPITRDRTERLSTATDDHPVFSPLGRTDSVMNSGDPPEQRTVAQANPTVVTQASNDALASRAASLRQASDPVSPIQRATTISPLSLQTVAVSSAPHLPETISPISPIEEPAVPARVLSSSGKRPASEEVVSTAKAESSRESATNGRGSWGYSITVMLDHVGAPVFMRPDSVTPSSGLAGRGAST